MTNKTEKEPEAGSIKSIPTLKYYQKMYGISCEGNDQKALKTFKNFEPKEKVQRLRSELIWVKNGYVSETVSSEIIGRKRLSRHNGYDKWAAWMLLLLAQK